jgi:hypothetical protein
MVIIMVTAIHDIMFFRGRETRNIAGLPSVTLADGLCVWLGEEKHALSSIFFSKVQQPNWGPCFLMVEVFKPHTPGRAPLNDLSSS